MTRTSLILLLSLVGATTASAQELTNEERHSNLRRGVIDIPKHTIIEMAVPKMAAPEPETVCKVPMMIDGMANSIMRASCDENGNPVVSVVPR